MRVSSDKEWNKKYDCYYDNLDSVFNYWKSYLDEANRYVKIEYAEKANEIAYSVDLGFKILP
jgi:hypothetical protein